MLTPAQAAARLQLSPGTIRKWIRRWERGSTEEPRLPAVKVGRRWLIREEDLAGLLSKGARALPPRADVQQRAELETRFQAIFLRAKNGRST